MPHFPKPFFKSSRGVLTCPLGRYHFFVLGLAYRFPEEILVQQTRSCRFSARLDGLGSRRKLIE